MDAVVFCCNTQSNTIAAHWIYNFTKSDLLRKHMKITCMQMFFIILTINHDHKRPDETAKNLIEGFYRKSKN